MSATNGHGRTSTPSGAGHVNAVRRSGCTPIGATPASAATSSHHAPAALMTTSVSNDSSGVVTIHAPSTNSTATAGALRRISPARPQALHVALMDGGHVDVHRVG